MEDVVLSWLGPLQATGEQAATSPNLGPHATTYCT